MESQSICALKQVVVLPTSFMMGLIVIEILVSCTLRGITEVQVMVRVCHTVPTSFVSAMVHLKAYWRLIDSLEAFHTQNLVTSLCSYGFRQLTSCMRL